MEQTRSPHTPRSLHILGCCMQILSNSGSKHDTNRHDFRETARHVPYRDSLLTLFLRDSLAGNSCMLMVCTICCSMLQLSPQLLGASLSPSYIPLQWMADPKTRLCKCISRDIVCVCLSPGRVESESWPCSAREGRIPTRETLLKVQTGAVNKRRCTVTWLRLFQDPDLRQMSRGFQILVFGEIFN